MTRVARYALLALVVAAPLSARAGDGVVPDHDRPRSTKYEARIDEKIGEQAAVDVGLKDEADQPTTLKDCIAGKPTIFVPVYYRCPMLCTQVLNGLLKALGEMPQDFTAGQQFNVVILSMDPKEHGGLASEKKKRYLEEYARGHLGADWRFLTGTKEGIAAVLDSVGYKFEFDKMLKEYNHPSAIVILSPEGKVTRYFYGIGYDKEYKLEVPTGAPPKMTTLRLSLVEAADGKGGSLLEKFTLLCYRYDALHQGYSLNVLRVVQISGALTLGLVTAGVLFALRRERVLGVFLKTAVPYVLGLVILPFFGLVLMVVLAPNSVMTLAPRWLVPYYVVACGALFAWHRAHAVRVAPEPTSNPPTGGIA